MSRPPLPPEKRRVKVTTIRLTESEHERMARAAKLKGQSQSEFMRVAILLKSQVVPVRMPVDNDG